MFLEYFENIFEEKIIMKKIILLLIMATIFIINKSYSQTPNGSCENAFPFCTGLTYNYPSGVNSGNGEVGPNYGCLYSTPNPTWYYMQIDQQGNIEIGISSPDFNDIDFVCWGPFTNPVSPCSTDLTAGVGSPTPNHEIPGPSTDYPTGNLIDCSYSVNSTEWCYIPNCQSGQYYIFLITNYSNQAGNIIFSQTNTSQVGAGTTNCGSVANVSGNFFFDENNNGIREITESGIAGGLVYAPSCGFYTQSNNVGNYDAYICSTPDTIWSYFYQPYTNITPAFYELSSNTSSANFAVTVTPGIYDVTTNLTNYTPARPGFDYQAMLTVSNIGTEQDCGTLTLNYDTLFDYISSTPPADIITNNTLTWNNICLPVFQNSNFNLMFHIDSTVALSLPYTFTSNFVSLQNDTNILNNSDTIAGITVGSFDPNDKQVTPSGEISNSAASAEQELEYTIRFQNTGTYQATTVKITDILSGWLQIPTFSILSSSHPCTYDISGQGNLQIIFNNINLQPLSTDEPGSHGFVKFKIRCKPTLANGGNVYNTANIFFDFNQAIVTNTTLTYTKLLTTNIRVEKEITKSINIEPNPAIDIVKVNFDYSGKDNLNIEVIDNLGKTALKQPVQNNQKTIDLNVSNLSSGTYMIHIFGKNYSVNEKLIKQ